MDKKIKVFVLADNPLAPSGVATQTRYMIQAMLKTGKFSFVCFGGAIKHHKYDPIRIEGYEDDWIIYPVDGYGTQDQVRSLIQSHKPDMVWIMTDPRFWGWLWEIENEIRSVMPIVYYHVWDNYLYPKYNRRYYMSNDFIATISKVTDDIVSVVAPEVDRMRIPHTVDTDIFRKLDEKTIDEFRKNNNLGLKSNGDKKFLFFWNNRNARRKMSGSVIWWFSEFLDKVGRDNACLIMHTEPKDDNGQDLEALMIETDTLDGRIMLSVNKMPPEQLAVLYGVCDCTINISDAEGFGLATLESLACEVPIIVNMTGGLQEQVTDGEDNWFGVGIQPSSKAVIGSQEVPYIYEDRVSKEDFIEALETMYNMPKEERLEMGQQGRNHVLQNYGHDNYCKLWEETLLGIHEKHGSWETRNHKSWELVNIK